MGLIGLDSVGHLVFGANEGGPAPTAAAGTAAGTGPPVPVMGAQALDMCGVTTFGTGTTPAAGQQVVVTFGTPYTTSAPLTILANGNTAATNALSELTVIPQGIAGNWTGFAVNSLAAPAASQANTAYGIAWFVIV